MDHPPNKTLKPEIDKDCKKCSGQGFFSVSLVCMCVFVWVSLSLQGFFSSSINFSCYCVLSWLKHLQKTGNRRGEMRIYFKR